MVRLLRKSFFLAVPLLLLAGLSPAQTSSISGKVIGEDGQPLQGALVKIERKDIKGSYKVKTKKKGDYFHAGLPLGTYRVSVEVNGKEVDAVDNVQTHLGDPQEINFNLQEVAKKRQALQKAAEAGQLTDEQTRQMSAEQREAYEKQIKERQQALAKNKALNDAFNAAMTALQAKQYPAAVDGFVKAAEIDAKQHVVWGQLAEAYMGMASQQTGAEHDATVAKGLEAYQKAIELKPDDAAYHNNYALALAKARKFDEAQAELTKAAGIDPPNAGRYFYNLGAVLVNIGQIEAAGEAFKKAIEADPNYADAQYQYGVYLISKAQTTPEGQVIPVPGTREAFEKYLQLRPDGQFAESAKGMLATMGQKVQTEYGTPANQKKGGKK
jgi:tetratricopeptide (TPR) repeat protein